MAFSGAGAIQGAGAGASMGSAFGPWGAAIGGVAGGLLGGFGGEDSGSDKTEAWHGAFDRNYQMQKEFAQNGIRWRVEDAKAAGIHPLFALGAQLPSAGAVAYIGDSGSDDTGSMGRALAEASQDITRAIDSTRTGPERFEARMNALQLERGELQNELLRSQIARLNQSVTPPSPSLLPMSSIPGQGDMANIEGKKQEVTIPSVLNASQEPGAITDRGFTWTGQGYMPVPSKDVKERIEDMAIPEIQWSLRNNIIPSYPNRPPDEWLKNPDNEWRWDVVRGIWREYPARFHKREVYRGSIPAEGR